MSDSTFSIVQNIFKEPHPPILVTTCPCTGLTPKIIQDFLQTAEDGIIGVAPAYGTKCVLSVIAFASATQVLLVRLSTSKKPKKGKRRSTEGRDILQEFLLCAHSHSKVAFQMDVLATSLYHDLDLRISGAVDLLSGAKGDRHSLEAIMNSIGGETSLNKPTVIALFKGEEKLDKTPIPDTAMQAWVAWRGATLKNMVARLIKVPRIDTSALTETVRTYNVLDTYINLPSQRLSVFAKLVRDTCRLSSLKPTSLNNEIANEYNYSDGQFQFLSTRYKNRLRIGPQVSSLVLAKYAY